MRTPQELPIYTPGQHSVIPIPFKAHKINGFCPQTFEHHYENIYGDLIRQLNKIEIELLRLKEPNCSQENTENTENTEKLKAKELDILNNIVLHELYFDSIGEEGGTPLYDSLLLEAVNTSFGSLLDWRADFIALANSLSNGKGWVILAWSNRLRRMLNIKIENASTPLIDIKPILVMNMDKHVYCSNYDSKYLDYIQAFMHSIHWEKASARFNHEITGLVNLDEEIQDPTQISVNKLKRLTEQNITELLILDVRHTDDLNRYKLRIMDTAWHDSFSVSDWAPIYPKNKIIIVYCMYGFWVSQKVAQELRELGYDARSLSGGICAWRAMGYASS